jgi:hypothetical protein
MSVVLFAKNDFLSFYQMCEWLVNDLPARRGDSKRYTVEVVLLVGLTARSCSGVHTCPPLSSIPDAPQLPCCSAVAAAAAVALLGAVVVGTISEDGLGFSRDKPRRHSDSAIGLVTCGRSR